MDTELNRKDAPQFDGETRQLADLARFPAENPNPVMRVDRDGFILYANGACAQLDFIPCRSGQLVPDYYRRIIAEIMDSGSYRVVEAKGKKRVFRLDIVPVVEGGYVNIYGLDITEHKKAEDALRESQRDLNRAQAVAQVGSWRMDVRRNVLLWSDENHRIFGIPEGTPMSYEDFLACVHPDDRAYVDRKWHDALQGEDYNIEHRIVVGDEVRWVRERAELEFDDKGMVRGGFGTTQDITEYKRMQQQLEFHNRILEQVHDIVIAVDGEQRVTYYNEAAQRTYQVSAADALGHRLDELYQTRWLRPEDERAAADALASKGVWVGESIHVKRDGQEIYVESAVNILKDETGAPIGTLAVIHDITARKQDEAQLAFNAKLLDTIEDTVINTDVGGRITYWGRGAMNLLGWKPEEIIGRNANEVLFAAESRQKMAGIGRLLLAKQSWSGELSVRRRDGTLLPLLIHNSPVLDASGNVIGVIGVGKDITERKKVEQLKDEFIGLVSHELRTPLTVVHGAIKTALDERVPEEERRELLRDAAWGTESLASILNNLLELSRYQADRLTLDKKTVNIREIVARTVRALGSQYPTRRVSVDIPGRLPLLLVDPGRLERILYNLIDNACKFSAEGSEVRVFARREKNEVIVGVSDQGVGISPEEQQVLFEPFSRVGGQSQTRGIGLGLVVCRRLVEAHGGRIWVESAPGEGATFLFTVPLPEMAKATGRS